MGGMKILRLAVGGTKIISENQGGYEKIMQNTKLYSTPLPGIKSVHPLRMEVHNLVVVSTFDLSIKVCRHVEINNVGDFQPLACLTLQKLEIIELVQDYIKCACKRHFTLLK